MGGTLFAGGESSRRTNLKAQCQTDWALGHPRKVVIDTVRNFKFNFTACRGSCSVQKTVEVYKEYVNAIIMSGG